MSSRRGIFDDVLGSPRLIANRSFLLPEYVPDELPHRMEQAHQVASTCGVALRGTRPENLLVFGKTGTGKTAVARYVGRKMEEVRAALATANPTAPPPPVQFAYINCKLIDTDYTMLVKLCTRMGATVPFSGWTIDRLGGTLVETLEKHGGLVIFCLDELDHFVHQTGDHILYYLTEINQELKRAQVSILGISNSAKFVETLDDRVRARLAKEQLVFQPYDAPQLQDILQQRADLAFEAGIVEPAVIPRCAAYAAKEHGDARRSMDLLRISAEIAEREGSATVAERHVEKATERIGVDILAKVVESLPFHSKLALWATVLEAEAGPVTIAAVEATYRLVCQAVGTQALKGRAVPGFLAELDGLGILITMPRSAGRRGKFYRPVIGMTDARRILSQEEAIQPALRFTTAPQTRL